MVSDLQRTWSVNFVDLEFDLDREGVLGVRPRVSGSWSARLCHMIVLWVVGEGI